MASPAWALILILGWLLAVGLAGWKAQRHPWWLLLPIAWSCACYMVWLGLRTPAMAIALSVLLQAGVLGGVGTLLAWVNVLGRRLRAGARRKH